ncbi:MAG: hypothetical protein ACRD4S_03945 [Candidatus Acidiferrales bacterium]
METIKQFAEKHRIRLNDRKHQRKYRITTSEDTVHGRFGEIVEDLSYGDVLAVKFIAVPRNASMNGALLSRYRKALAGGLTLKKKYGDAESTFHFDPMNAEQSALAVKLVGAKRRRTVILSPEQKDALRERLRLARQAIKTPVPSQRFASRSRRFRRRTRRRIRSSASATRRRSEHRSHSYSRDRGSAVRRNCLSRLFYFEPARTKEDFDSGKGKASQELYIA